MNDNGKATRKNTIMSDHSLPCCKIGTSRLVLPIETIVLPDGSEKIFGESLAIDLIRSHVLQECQRRVEALLTAQDLQ